jgi:hypothetical protein
VFAIDEIKKQHASTTESAIRFNTHFMFHSHTLYILISSILLCTLWFITPYAAVYVAQEHQAVKSNNAIVARVRARKQLDLNRRHPMTDTELLMFYSRSKRNSTGNNNPPTPSKRITTWLRKLRVWVMAG